MSTNHQTTYEIALEKSQEFQKELSDVFMDLVSELEDSKEELEWCENKLKFYEDGNKEKCTNCFSKDRCNIAALMLEHGYNLEWFRCVNWEKDFRFAEEETK